MEWENSVMVSPGDKYLFVRTKLGALEVRYSSESNQWTARAFGSRIVKTFDWRADAQTAAIRLAQKLCRDVIATIEEDTAQTD